LPSNSLKSVLDASVFVDYYVRFPQSAKRHERARNVVKALSRIGAEIYEPFILEIELAGVLVRVLNREDVLRILRIASKYVRYIDEAKLHETAAEVALSTGCRAVDSYYIAAAKKFSAILITSDGVAKLSAERVGVELLRLLSDEDYRALMDRLHGNSQ